MHRLGAPMKVNRPVTIKKAHNKHHAVVIVFKLNVMHNSVHAANGCTIRNSTGLIRKRWHAYNRGGEKNSDYNILSQH